MTFLVNFKIFLQFLSLKNLDRADWVYRKWSKIIYYVSQWILFLKLLPITCSIFRGIFSFPGFWFLHLSNVYDNTNNWRGNSLLVVDISSIVVLFILNVSVPFKDSARQLAASLSPQHSTTNTAWWSFLLPGKPDTKLFTSEDSERSRQVQWCRRWDMLHAWAAGLR